MAEKKKLKVTPLPIPDELRAKIAEHAEANRRGFMAEILVLIEEALAARGRRK